MPDFHRFRKACRDSLGRDHTDLYGAVEQIMDAGHSASERMALMDLICKAWMEAKIAKLQKQVENNSTRQGS